MIEIRIHGRGGQGNVVAANLLAMVAFEAGYYGQAFPNFGAERRGAPVTAFVRIAKNPIKRRSQVQYPHYLIIQDDALLHVTGVTDGLLEQGKILINSKKEIAQLFHSSTAITHSASVPATHLAQQYLGKPLPNTALLSAFLTLTQLFSIDTLIHVLQHKFTGTILENNTQLIHQAAKMVQSGQWQEHHHAESS